MIKQFIVKDYALIASLSVEFSAGLNIITGETGAGKSIIIDAMSLLLGGRASGDVVRRGASKSIVEGVFETSRNRHIKTFCDEHSLDAADELILRREVSAKGTSRCFINDTPVTLAALKEAGDLLVDIHGQHEHQALLKTAAHINYLDDYCGNDGQLQSFQQALKGQHALFDEYHTLVQKEDELRQKKDFYQFQFNEISSVDPVAAEDEQIAQELRIMENAEKITELTRNALALLYDGEANAYHLLSTSIHDLTALNKFDSAFHILLTDLQSAAVSVKETAAALEEYQRKIDLDPERLEYNRTRMLALNNLKKKYGGSLAAVMAKKDELQKLLLDGDSFENSINRVRKALAQQRTECGLLAEELSAARKKNAAGVISGVVNELHELGMPYAQFDVRFLCTEGKGEHRDDVSVNDNTLRASMKGIDEVEFYINTNKGEELKPLVKVASGGEVSRVMLSLKSILAKNDRLPLLIFDEIDTGVSGRIAQRVGLSLKNLAAFHQIIAITHLPQIAGLADQHYTVEKSEQEGRMSTSIRRLTDKERVNEVAKLISGEHITETSLKSARELIKQ